MKKFCCVAVLIFASAIFLNADNSKKKDQGSVQELDLMGDTSGQKFPELKDYKLKLSIVSEKASFYAEEDIHLTFRLTNESDKKLIVHEWMMNEGDNIKIYYKPYDANFKTFNESEWTAVALVPKKPLRRAPLQLEKGTAVLVDKIVSIPAEMKVKRGGVYYVAGALNLSSLKLLSLPSVVVIK